MRIIFGSILTILAIIVVAVIAIPFLVSTDWIRDQVVARVNEETGRSLTIGGQTSLSVFPNLALTVGQVAFSNPAGRDGTFVRMEELDVGLKLLPLLSGAVEVDRLVLTRPVFNLEIDPDGRPNWRFGDPVAAPGDAAKSPAAAGPNASGSAMPAIDSVQLSGVKIVAGAVSYRDPASSTFQEITDINANLNLPSLANPMVLAGTLSWQSEQVSFSTELAEPQALSTGTPTAFAVEIDAPQLQLSLNGQLTVRDGFTLVGTIKVSTPSVKKMARWMDVQTPDVPGLGPFTLTAGLKADETGVALEQAALSLDDMTAEGGLLIGIGGKKPVIRATLAASAINFDKYIAGAGSPAIGGNGGTSPSTAPARSNGPGGGDWSDQPIDISALRAFDADVRVSAAGLTFGGIEAGPSALAVTLKDALLRIDLSELQLYDGRAAGRLTINGGSKTPAIAAAFNFDNVQANPLLIALAGFKWLEGRAKITGSLASRGLSQRGLVSALNGEINMLFSDGAVRGLNVAQMVRNVQVGNIAGLTSEGAQKTDFSTFSTSFNITRGIAQTNDIKMLSPLIRISGGGVADLPGQTLDFRINPKIVASIEGQGGANQLAGIEVPILIRGPWSNPKIAPDIEGLLRDPSRTIEAAKDIGKVLQKALGDDPKKTLKNAIRNPGDFLKQLSGGGSVSGQDGAGVTGTDGQGANAAPTPIGEDLFKRLLGQ